MATTVLDGRSRNGDFTQKQGGNLSRLHAETHLVARIGWLRAAVLGANDGIGSTASLIVGVASASATRGDVLVAGIAGLVAGAMSMVVRIYSSPRSA
jgi:vacuolar iron transporter family protein